MDNILDQTLSGISSTPLPKTPSAMQVPDLTGNNQADIKTLSGVQQQPSQLLNLQKAMQLGSSQAYKERQATEMGITSQQFDPTKVSGGTFASIIGNLEQNRGMDIGKIYSSTMSTYQKVQDAITDRMEFLQNLEEQKKQWEEEMSLKKKELARLEKTDKRAAKEWEEEMKEDKRRWELEYADKKNKAKSDISSLSDQAIKTTEAEWNYINGGQNKSYNTPTGQPTNFFGSFNIKN